MEGLDSDVVIISDDEESETVQDQTTLQRPLRIQLFVMFLICLSNLGIGFSNDNPNALQDAIMQDINVNAASYDLLLTFTAMPNVVMAILSGYIVDNYIGPRKSIVIFSLVALLGQGLFTLGAYLNLFPVMVIGRLVFGSAAESIAVACNTFAGIWLKGIMITVFFSIQQSFIKTCEFLNMFYMYKAYQFVQEKFVHLSGYKCLGIVFMIGFFACLLSVIAAIILGILDYRKRRNIGANNSGEDVFKLKDFKKLGINYWILVFVCGMSYSASTSFNGLSLTYFQYKYNLVSTTAAEVQSIYIFTAIVLSPIIGTVVSMSGFDLIYLTASGVIVVVTHYILAFSFISPKFILPCYSLGSTSRNVILWTLVSYIVPENKLGIAYGTMQAFQNLCLTIFPIISGVIVDHVGLTVFELFNCFLFLVALSGIVVLLFLQIQVLENAITLMSSKQRNAYMSKKEEDAPLSL